MRKRSLDSREVIEEIDKLASFDGRVTPQTVVDAARDPKHRLHGCFIWDDTLAAQEYRLDQARRLLKVRVEISTTERLMLRAPVYIRDPQSPHHEQGYRSIAHIASEPEQSASAVVAECKRAAAILSRARDIAVLLGFSDDIENLVRQIVALSTRVENAQFGNSPTQQASP